MKNSDMVDECWVKRNPIDTIWWKQNVPFWDRSMGDHIFSFDKKTGYNLFVQYPYDLTDEQEEVFDKENPFWKEFFADRKKHREE